jgi:hypothetical protein
MKEFLLLFRGGEGDELRKSPEAWQKHMEIWGKWMGELSEQGKMLGAQPLERTGHVINGTQKIVTDGPFMEGKEMVGGYLMCKAENYDEALAIAKECPILEFDNGIVEVREVASLNM